MPRSTFSRQAGTFGRAPRSAIGSFLYPLENVCQPRVLKSVPAGTMDAVSTAADPRRRRQERERELVVATRALFDERGMQDAPIEEIARNAGIARGLVYRQFSSKEELFVLTVTDYLDELEGVLVEAVAADGDPVAQLGRVA